MHGDIIQSIDWSGALCTLVDSDGEPVRVGDQLPDFRGDIGTISGGRAPHKPSSSGFIHKGCGECYAGVYGCQWVQL